MNIKFIICFLLYFGTIFSQCENYNIEECFEDPHCLWEENLVLDQTCGRVNVQQNMGFIRMAVPMEYPLLPIIPRQTITSVYFSIGIVPT